MNDWFIGAVCVCALLFSFAMGWVFAHGTVAWECSNVGTFYVSNTVYDCKAKHGGKP